MTAEGLLKNTTLLNPKLYPKKQRDFEKAIQCMEEFARYHVEQALKEASIKATVSNKAKFKGDINPQVDIDSILNAYPLENIK